jgi:anti-sigma factor RsiW
MCPDPQLISVYLDGELPSPWKEKIESHLEHCPECSGKLARYRLLRADTAHEEIAMQAAKERVWQKLASQKPVAFRSPERAFAGGIWRSKVSIPLPAAAALIVAVIAMFFLLRPAEQADTTPNMMLASEEILPGIIPASDMNGVLQYLGALDGGEIIILHLPESRNFSSKGDPAIINATDYSRRGK